MTKLDDRFRPLATNLIAKYGKSVTYTSVSSGSYNTATGEAANTESTSTIKAIVEDYGSLKQSSGFESGHILAGDKKFTIAAQSFSSSPKETDKITVDGITYMAIRVIETWSGEQIASYEIQGRT